MRTISLHQPWASAVAIGLKNLETRSRLTNCLGPLAIHAALKRSVINCCIFEKWITTIPEICIAFQKAAGDGRLNLYPGRLEYDCLPFGAVIATCHLRASGSAEFFKPTPTAKELGDFSPGRAVWVLEDIVALPEPIPFKGKQGFFEVPDDLLK
jgi:hypothetical protein